MLRVPAPDAEGLREGGAVPEGEREAEPQGDVVAPALPVGGRAVADTVGL